MHRSRPNRQLVSQLQDDDAEFEAPEAPSSPQASGLGSDIYRVQSVLSRCLPFRDSGISILISMKGMEKTQPSITVLETLQSAWHAKRRQGSDQRLRATEFPRFQATTFEVPCQGSFALIH
ncbi:uncharacterized protein PV07_11245 [Cladophialophora immunda]|uniref:Uncharacterized protein n=1 Tax=Cladophialophora immunda TaxID=569365 RepID=A0A0D1Z634_9EURO|nr:uncharacterized protein PV07_11245 [Cladophialophora immunda]KIW23011.1 hypothetical protein PV07_11245 [Cladophialophora immunda]